MNRKVRDVSLPATGPIDAVEGPEGEPVPTRASKTTEAEISGEEPGMMVVRYVGEHPTRAREITKMDFVRAGVPENREGLRTLRWGPENHWTLRREELDFLEPAEFAAIITPANGLVTEEG